MARYYRYRDRRWEAGPRAIWILVLANVAVFIAILFAPQAIGLFAVQRLSLPVRPWTVVTSMFLHAGWFHILGNMYMLWFFGDQLERFIGEKKFLLVYFLGGLVGNGLFLLLASPFASAIGASGAVFAVGGALVVMRPKIKVMMFPLPIPMDLWVFIILVSVLFGILLPAGGNTPIAWQAHLGGLLTGLAFGWYFRRWERRRGIYS